MQIKTYEFADAARMVTPHFRLSELWCPCCRRAPEVEEWQLPGMLEQLRHHGGDLPLKVNSAFRCGKHNAQVGGQPLSMHMAGLAADIECPVGDRRYTLVSAAIKSGFRGIGIRPSFCHVDLRDGAPVLFLYKGSFVLL
jgi:zinc D-Ala-D-Ala carboxypeptidase